MLPVLMVFFVALVVLLSIRWETRTVDPLVLLFGILIAGIVSASYRYFNRTMRQCPACGRLVQAPAAAAFCHFCGAPLGARRQ